MWPRVIEVMLGCWLLMSPFIFGHTMYLHDITVGTLVITCALLSYWKPTRNAHWGQCLLAAWLIGFGYLAAPAPPPPGLQNHVVLGWLLVMFGIIPNHANDPPTAWRHWESGTERLPVVSSASDSRPASGLPARS